MKIYATFLLLSLSSSVMSCEYIDGYWRSDKEKSVSYNEQVSPKPPKSIALIIQSSGIQEIIYTANTAHFLSAPTTQIDLDGQSYPMNFPEVLLNYTVVTCQPDKVSLDMSDNEGVALAGQVDIHLESTDVYWVSLLPPWREYFTRQHH
jgi:hypothetical protein